MMKIAYIVVYYVNFLASFDVRGTCYLTNVNVTLLCSFVYHHLALLLQYLFIHGFDIVHRIEVDNYELCYLSIPIMLKGFSFIL